MPSYNRMYHKAQLAEIRINKLAPSDAQNAATNGKATSGRKTNRIPMLEK